MFERKLTILYGSQTGTAQDLSEEIWRQSKIYHFKGQIIPMDFYDVQNLIYEKLVIFVCSTTGQGDEPDNMKFFWKFLLRKSLPSNSLAGLKFGVLGLGDSSYSKFNFVAKRLNKRLLQLGGTSILPLGLCDDQHDLGASAVSGPWICDLWKNLENLYPLPVDLIKLKSSPRVYRWNLKIIDDDKENNVQLSKHLDDIIYSDSKYDKNYDVIVENNQRTTNPNHFQDVRLISFTADKVKWSPGDVLVCRPRNSKETVKQLFDLFTEHCIPLYPETLISIEEIDDEMQVPEYLQKPLSLKTLATKYWDLSAIPRTRVFELLAINCTNELEQEKLIELTKPEFQEDLYNYVNRPRRTILEVLYDFPHATSSLTIQIIFELFQPIKQRSFSIASCPEMNKLQLLVAVVEYKTIMSTLRLGLCSNWLKNLRIGEKIQISIRSGTFILPENDNIPLIMIGPGTGLAPFRSIILQKEMKNIKGYNLVLFFGCRNEKMDFHCEDELKRLETKSIIKLFCAFSRDQEDKIYVQHKIKEQSELLKNLIINKSAYIYIAGNSKNMPQSVKSQFIEILKCDEKFIDNLIKLNRYQEETWG